MAVESYSEMTSGTQVGTPHSFPFKSWDQLNLNHNMILVHKVTPFSWDHSGNTCYQMRNQRLNSVSSVSGHYFAFLSNSIPKVFPSVSWQVANHPTVGIAIFGINTFPPFS